MFQKQAVRHASKSTKLKTSTFELLAHVKSVIQPKSLIILLATTLTLFDGVQIKKSTIALLISVIDAVIIIVFLAMVFTLKYAQKSATDNVLKKAYSSSAYTVQIKNLPQDMPSEELAARLWNFLDYKLGNKESYGNHRVVDIQIVLPNKIIMFSKEIGDIIREVKS